jgi:hypothetical protein
LPLLDTGATVVSLQKDIRPDDAAVLDERGDILDAGGEFADFSDTAALVSQLDLVITVDTSVARSSGWLRASRSRVHACADLLLEFRNRRDRLVG